MPKKTSPFAGMRELELQIKSVVQPLDMDELTEVTRKAVRSLKQLVVDAKLDARDYEFSDTRADQVRNAVAAKNRIKLIEVIILNAPDVFSAVDTAHITAKLEQINGWIE
ncbi:MAG: hypothetical protein JWO47_1095 [Candidatus Saccharibacteria bacterium]|nr:hypothetical protein [Candidatus Saccharibacteria bacterium]